MCESRIELSVGDSVRIEDQILTVLDVSGDEITFRLDFVGDSDSENLVCGNGSEKRPPR